MSNLIERHAQKSVGVRSCFDRLVLQDALPSVAYPQVNGRPARIDDHPARGQHDHAGQITIAFSGDTVLQIQNLGKDAVHDPDSDFLLHYRIGTQLPASADWPKTSWACNVLAVPYPHNTVDPAAQTRRIHDRRPVRRFTPHPPSAPSPLPRGEGLSRHARLALRAAMGRG